VLLFHFGLGNEVDREFVALTNPQNLTGKITIIPGHSYTVLHFASTQDASNYLESMTRIGDKPVSFAEIHYQNLSRTLIFLYCKENFTKEVESATVPDCSSVLAKNNIPGLHLYTDILTREEESALLLQIDEGQW
jgi:hypothetical protein